uniref:Uncharacterized protein LOC100186076 n=1 Tax=Phallusia mammillata TaxID=59560 RepID=A0A6F9DHP4_9ASCI|nr:uncharacterized protein LOC100186076 [Phallusia mammillata]
MDKAQLALIFLGFVCYLGSFIFAYLNTFGVEGLYFSTNGDVDNKYFQQASPKAIAFAIVWPIIYLWNLAGIVYILVSCCLADEKSPVKMTPTLVPKIFWLGYCLAFGSTVGWLFAFDREILGLSFALLLIAVLSVYLAIGTSCKVVADNVDALEANNKVVLWLMRILIQNGLSTLATWLTVATLLNLADIIIYEDSFGVTPAVLRGNISVINGSTVSLAILLVIVITWFVLENFVFEKYCRYIYTIYPVLILATSALIDKLRALPDSNQNLIMASVDLAVVLVALIARVVLAILRRNKRSQRRASLDHEMK